MRSFGHALLRGSGECIVDETGRENLARMAWERNAATDVVTFAFDEEGRLVGRVVHPLETLDQPEFDLYVLTLLGGGR